MHGIMAKVDLTKMIVIKFFKFYHLVEPENGDTGTICLNDC